MEKPTKLTLEVKTHQIEFGLRPDGRRVTIYREDKIDESKCKLHNGFQDFLFRAERPGFIEIKSQYYRPHSDIAYIELKESTVTQVVTLEKQPDNTYQITNIE